MNAERPGHIISQERLQNTLLRLLEDPENTTVQSICTGGTSTDYEPCTSGTRVPSQTIDNIHTIETSAATVKFSGAASSSDSDTDSEYTSAGDGDWDSDGEGDDKPEPVTSSAVTGAAAACDNDSQQRGGDTGTEQTGLSATETEAVTTALLEAQQSAPASEGSDDQPDSSANLSSPSMLSDDYVDAAAALNKEAKKASQTAGPSGNDGASGYTSRSHCEVPGSSDQVHVQSRTTDIEGAGQYGSTANRNNGPTYEERLAQMRRERFNPFNRPGTADTESSPSPERHNSESSDSWVDTAASFSPNGHMISISDFPQTDISNAELGLAEDHFSTPEGHFGMSTTEELQMAIRNCKLLILEAPEESERRKNLVTKLIQLRMKLLEAKDGPDEKEEDRKQVVGHSFRERGSKSSKHYCEKCNTVIWGMVQTWYQCTGCGFCCHAKCLNLITRTCASVKVLENPTYILSICPEKGLSAQNYRCAECRAEISYKPGCSEPRQCDYTGSYYCELCHWNDLMIIPARVLHNWDLEPRKVCRASKQFLRLMLTKAALRVQDINPMLFNFVEELNEVKKLREEILVMKLYFLTCQDALKSKLLLQLQGRQHFVESSDMYALQDLIDVAMDTLLPELAKVHTSFAQHIKTDCERCRAKGYICELCDMNEVLFPFDNIAIVCSQCSTVLHRHCFMRRNQKCPKCERISHRTQGPPGSKVEDTAR